MDLHVWSRGIAAMLVLAFLPSTGCSWLGVSKPPNGPIHAAPPLECTSERGAPVTDTALAAGLLGIGGAFFIAGSTYPHNLSSGAAALGGAVFVAAAVPYAFSAGYGYSTTSQCRHLKETQLSCVSGVEASCRSLEERKP